jgi:hypothetical protein
MGTRDYNSDVDARWNPAFTSKALQTTDYSDTVDVTITDSTSTEDQQAAKHPRAFHANADGTLAAMMVGDSAAVPLVIKEGLTYPYAVKRFMVTGTDATFRSNNNNIIALR